MSQNASGETTPKTISKSDAWYPTSQRDLYVVRQLVTKDFKLKYRRSILGIAWSVLNPLLMMCVQAVVFTKLMSRHDSSIPNFPIYLILGNTAWHLMSDATNAGMQSIIHAQSLLKKVRINRWVFPVQKVLFAVVNYTFSLVAVALVMTVFRWTLSPWALMVPLGVLYLTVFCIGLSLLLSALAVFFRDVIHLWGVVLTAWMYLTPLFYSVTILPDWMQSAMRFNPMYLYITFIRRCLLWKMSPGPLIHVGCVGCALLMLAIGYTVFRKLEDRFILFI
ncbi:MAG: ABC transporter permease [Acidobacteriota bacterium]|nr:ABC transporter permease [Acidobacteriota bacterium]